MLPVFLSLLTSLSPVELITSPIQFFGHEIGADYVLPNYQDLSRYWKLLDKESEKMVLQSIGKTAEGREQYMAIVSSSENIKNLNRYRTISMRLAQGEGLLDSEAEQLAEDGKAIVWIDGGLHATETLGAQQLMETLYQLISKDNAEVRRILDKVIILFVHANPDGMDLVSDWYMSEKDNSKKNTRVPRLYQKYIGHDNNRDFYMASQAETQNMCKVMYRQWFPQIVYNHHQTGPRGTVLFCPPFRDPFNQVVDPQVITSMDWVGMAMHTRFLAEGKAGSSMRGSAPYSCWFNGGLRTTAYFHNMIGILTETIGSPTPTKIPFVANRMTPQGLLPMPPGPQEWHFRQSVDYSVTANMAILDLASRNSDKLLMGAYTIARRQIGLGSKDSWIDYPHRTGNAKAIEELRKPELRCPRAYVIPSSQEDFSTAVRFVNALLHNGIRVIRLQKSAVIGGKGYEKGSFVIKTNQAFRPHILDMFEPQDHPDDIPVPGADPIPPYDNAGYTLALQMGIAFDRVLEGADVQGEILREPTPELPLPAVPKTAINDSYRWAFERLAQGKTTFQNKHEFGEKPVAGGLKLAPVRVGLWDEYGGSMESGWDRFLFEKFSVPFRVLFPHDINVAGLKEKVDVLVLPEGAFEPGQDDEILKGIPSKYEPIMGALNAASVPNLKAFAEAGGTIIALGDSTSLAASMNLGIKNHLVEGGKPIPRSKFYIPGSLLDLDLDLNDSINWGMKSPAVVMFDSSPVFDLDGTTWRRQGWYSSEKPLRSGWGWGQKALFQGTEIATIGVGKGKLVLLGPVINHRFQSHGTFKILFNAIIQSGAVPVQ